MSYNCLPAAAEIDIGLSANGILVIGVFLPTEGGTAAAQGTIGGGDFGKKWMTLSERIIGSKKLHEMVIPGATHALSADLTSADRFAIYFFAS